MDAVRLRNMAFLLSLGGLPPACFSDGGPSTSGAGTGGTGGTTGGSTGSTTDDTGTSSPATGTSTGVPPTTGTTADPTTTTSGPATTGTTEASTTTGTTTEAMPVDPVCYPYATTIVSCDPGSYIYEEIVAYCNNVIVNGTTLHGGACTVALEEWFACIAALECRQVDAEFEMSSLCLEQEQAIGTSCPELDW